MMKKHFNFIYKKKKDVMMRPYSTCFVFLFFDVKVERLQAFLISVGGSFKVAGPGPTVDTHQYRIINTAGDDKVGFIINPAIAFVAKSKSVQVPFRGERANFITGGAVIINTGHNTLCSKGPVVRSSSSSSHFVVVV